MFYLDFFEVLADDSDSSNGFFIPAWSVCRKDDTYLKYPSYMRQIKISAKLL